MHAPLRILHLEDNAADSHMILSTLHEGGIACTIQRVTTETEFTAALRQGSHDVILADYALPGFDGAAALSLAQKLRPDLPFLFVSGTLAEETAIDLMHHGATDYISKERLGRLVPSVQRAMRALDDRLERKRAEDALRLSEQQFRQAQKMEAVGRLAGGLAHDFNNLLTVIMGHGQVLLEELTPTDPARAKIEAIHKAGERAATLVRQLLAFSRKQPLEPKVLTLGSIVTNLENLLRRLIGEDIQLTLRVDSEQGYVRADPAQLEQVIMNLVVNARDAMPQGGILTIETSQVELSRTPMYYLRPLPPGPYMKLSVTDTGVGMDGDTFSHLFEPFFTTKPKDKGTGLGLSTAFGIVTKSGGGIDVSTQVKLGTKFDVYLPRIDPLVVPVEENGTPATARKGTETILLVEDEASVREVVAEQLRRRGYRILEAKNGVEACLIATQRPAELDLLVTDVVMPLMNGRELAQHLRAIKPDLKVVYISGYVDDTSLMLQGGGGLSAFLQKPFTPDTLTNQIRQLLDDLVPLAPPVPRCAAS